MPYIIQRRLRELSQRALAGKHGTVEAPRSLLEAHALRVQHRKGAATG